MNTIYFINPNLVVQKGDFLGSGIPFMPIILAYTLGYLDKFHVPYHLIDSFGQNPFQIHDHGNFYWQGITLENVISQIKNPEAIFIYASAMTNFEFNYQLIKKVRTSFTQSKIIVISNTQAVTSFNVIPVAHTLITAGTNIIVYNNIEKTSLELTKNNFTTNISNIIFKDKGKIKINPKSKNLGIFDESITPAWDKFPLNNYWNLGYSHGPGKNNKYLALLTSYGCPYKCKFCVNPSLNDSLWQPKPAEFVFQEIKYLLQNLHVSEFHIEDLDPTVDKKRIQKLCRLIIDHKLIVDLKLVSGTKVETIDEETVILMKQAGFSYISISPESGSPQVLKLIDKPFNFEHADKIIKKCHQVGIKTQACFVLGFPGEKKSHQQETQNYIKHITKLGIDEIAIFIITPLPGSAIYRQLKGYKNFSDLTFSPVWRSDYLNLSKLRQQLYIYFIFWKTIYWPFCILKQFVNFIQGKFDTKMEMIPYRILRFNQLLFQNKINRLFYNQKNYPE